MYVSFFYCLVRRIAYISLAHGLGLFESVHSVSGKAIREINSIPLIIVFLPAWVVGCLFDLGYFRSVFLTSSAILVVATFLIGQCTKYWHFLLCQGILVGVRPLVHKPTPAYLRVLDVFRLVAAAFSGLPPRSLLTGSKNAGVSQWALSLWDLQWGELFYQLPRGTLFRE